MFYRAIDIGGSQTRIAATKENVKVYESESLSVDLNSNTKSMIEDKRSDFIIRDTPRGSIRQKRFVKGTAILYYHGVSVTTDNQSAKVRQDATYVNAVYTLACELLDAGVSRDSATVGICIPTAEFYADSINYVEELKSYLAGSHTVEFPLLGKEVTFDIGENDIKVFPEGVIAAYRFIKDRRFTKGISIIVDAGYRSTDVTVLKDFKPVGKGARSLPIGGITIEAMVMGELERDGLFVSSREEARNAIISGVLCSGSERVAIAPYLKRAQTQFSSLLKDAVIDVLSYSMMTLRSINNIIFIGRPFTPNDGEGLGDVFVDMLGTSATVFPIDNLGTVNCTEMIGVLRRGTV